MWISTRCPSGFCKKGGTQAPSAVLVDEKLSFRDEEREKWIYTGWKVGKKLFVMADDLRSIVRDIGDTEKC